MAQTYSKAESPGEQFYEWTEYRHIYSLHI